MTMTTSDPTELQRRKRQRMRSIAIACALVGIAVLFYVVTLVRLGANVASRGM